MLDVLVSVVIVPSSLVVLVWAYFVLKKSASREVSFRSVTALGLFIAAAKALAMALGTSEPRPSWAFALAMLCIAAWIVRIYRKFNGDQPTPTLWDTLI